ncbi:MAG: LytTR family DNA-binding domain-containing protein [Christensenella sp.]
MIKIAICEDKQNDLLLLLSYIDKYSVSNALHAEIKCYDFCSGSRLIEAIEHGANFDIVFLDVMMPGLSGLDTAKEIRQIGYGAIIVFMSISKDFALDAYSVRAYDYILKPISKERLFLLLDEIISESLSQANKYIILRRSTSLLRILFNKIRHIEVIQKRLYFTMNDDAVFDVAGTMGSVEKTLMADARFLKPHRSYIVNMDYIDTINSKEICMLDNAKIPIPKALFAKVKAQFIDYCIYSK